MGWADHGQDSDLRLGTGAGVSGPVLDITGVGCFEGDLCSSQRGETELVVTHGIRRSGPECDLGRGQWNYLPRDFRASAEEDQREVAASKGYRSDTSGKRGVEGSAWGQRERRRSQRRSLARCGKNLHHLAGSAVARNE